MRTQWKEGGGEDEEENVWLSQKTRTKVLAVSYCERLLLMNHYRRSVSSTINSIVFWFRGKSLKYDEVLCRIELLFLCIVFLVSWMHTLPGENIHPLLPQKPGSLRWFAWGTRGWNILLKPWKSISRKSYSQELLSTVSPLAPYLPETSPNGLGQQNKSWEIGCTQETFSSEMWEILAANSPFKTLSTV